MIIKFAAPMFFANSSELGDAAKEAIRAAGDQTVEHLVVDLEAVTDVDVTGAEGMESLLSWLESQHIELGFSRGSPEIIARLDHFGLLRGATVYRTNRDAIAALAGGSQPSPSP